MQVSCEGYEYPDDPYILKESCGLEYEIDVKYYYQPSLFSFTNIFLIVAIGLLLYLLYLDCLEVDTTASRPHTMLTTSPLDVIRRWFDSLIQRLFQIFIDPVVDKLIKVLIDVFTLPFRRMFAALPAHTNRNGPVT